MVSGRLMATEKVHITRKGNMGSRIKDFSVTWREKSTENNIDFSLRIYLAVASNSIIF
jgi:hypothetical protein